MQAPLRVLVADAQAVLRAGYRKLAEQALSTREVTEAAEADETLHAWCELRPDLAVIGVALPPAGGLEVTRRIHAVDASAAILLFGLVADAYLAMRAIDAGALGFVSRDDSRATIERAMRQVQAHQPFLAPPIMQRVALQRVSPRTDPIASLSSREFEIFRLLTEGKPVSEVAALLSLSARSVANYQTQIKRKLGVSTSAGMVHVAIRHGVVQMAGN
jgi:DNA-binding NarL/FixJ family response regulator